MPTSTNANNKYSGTAWWSAGPYKSKEAGGQAPTTHPAHTGTGTAFYNVQPSTEAQKKK